MDIDSGKSFKRLLEPFDRLSEILFGLIMVLTFTCSISVTQAGRDDIRMMLAGAVGCNVAWGVIDAFFFYLACVAANGSGLRVFKAVRAADSVTAQRLIADALPPVVAAVMPPAELASLHERLKQLPEPPKVRRLSKDEWLGGLGVFLLVFLSTFPVVLPFIFLNDARLALRISNAIAIVLLFLVGWKFGTIAGRSPLRVGIIMVLLGSAFVALAMALGG